ncbi:hypothetical protein T4E_12001 [Trichinella pseudospiralis]|uniref:Uncharacterized protein n=1 Tax=Trichinella pseudospiralis TaxID=6337 RepID=A0A0V0XEF0_TRIPS|nr:hypothetical protein T4E_12001 [Trichinella pseudospiralis]
MVQHVSRVVIFDEHLPKKLKNNYFNGYNHHGYWEKLSNIDSSNLGKIFPPPMKFRILCICTQV